MQGKGERIPLWKDATGTNVFLLFLIQIPPARDELERQKRKKEGGVKLVNWIWGDHGGASRRVLIKIFDSGQECRHLMSLIISLGMPGKNISVNGRLPLCKCGIGQSELASRLTKISLLG